MRAHLGFQRRPRARVCARAYLAILSVASARNSETAKSYKGAPLETRGREGGACFFDAATISPENGKKERR